MLEVYTVGVVMAMPTVRSWNLFYPRNDEATYQFHTRVLHRDRNVTALDAVESLDIPGWYVNVTFRQDALQPQSKALHHLPARYPLPTGETNVTDDLVITDQEPPPEEYDPPAMSFFKSVLEAAQPRPRKPRHQKTVFDHLMDDEDD